GRQVKIVWHRNDEWPWAVARRLFRIVTPKQCREFFPPHAVVRFHRQVGEQRSGLSGSERNRDRAAAHVRFDREPPEQTQCDVAQFGHRSEPPPKNPRLRNLSLLIRTHQPQAQRPGDPRPNTLRANNARNPANGFLGRPTVPATKPALPPCRKWEGGAAVEADRAPVPPPQGSKSWPRR